MLILRRWRLVARLTQYGQKRLNKTRVTKGQALNFQVNLGKGIQNKTKGVSPFKQIIPNLVYYLQLGISNPKIDEIFQLGI